MQHPECGPLDPAGAGQEKGDVRARRSAEYDDWKKIGSYIILAHTPHLALLQHINISITAMSHGTRAKRMKKTGVRKVASKKPIDHWHDDPMDVDEVFSAPRAFGSTVLAPRQHAAFDAVFGSFSGSNSGFGPSSGFGASPCSTSGSTSGSMPHAGLDAASIPAAHMVLNTCLHAALAALGLCGGAP